MKKEVLWQKAGAEGFGAYYKLFEVLAAAAWYSKKGKQDNGLYQQREKTHTKKRDLITVWHDIIPLERTGWC